MVRTGRLMLVLAVALAAAWGGLSLRAEEPKAAFEVHDLSLWILEPGSQQANLRTAYPSALPGTVRSAFPAAASPAVAANGISAVPAAVSSAGGTQRDAGARHMGPVNLITFYGHPTANLDVDLRTKAGTFLTHWPAGESLPNRLRWSGMPGMDLVEKIEDESELAFVDSEHWIRKARAGQALFVRRGARAERFLAYDVELNLPPPIRLEGGPDTFTVINTSGATLHDVLISRGTPAGRHVAWLDVLPPSKPAVPAAAKPAKVAPDVFGDGKAPATAAGTPPPEAKAAATEKEQEKASDRARVKRFLELQLKPKRGGAPAAPRATGVEVTLSEPLAVGAGETAAKTTGILTERLSRAGLNAHEVELFLDNYRWLFFEGDAVVVACRLDAGAIDEKIPLSVFPEPAKIVRVAMVLMRNADPQLGSEVDRLVAQLGEPKFSVREAAQKRLMELGPLTFPALNKALNSTDLEIVIRAERILLYQNQTLNPPAQPKPGAGGAGAGGAAGGAAKFQVVK